MHVIKFIILSYGHILIFIISITNNISMFQLYKILYKWRKCETNTPKFKILCGGIYAQNKNLYRWFKHKILVWLNFGWIVKGKGTLKQIFPSTLKQIRNESWLPICNVTILTIKKQIQMNHNNHYQETGHKNGNKAIIIFH